MNELVKEDDTLDDNDTKSVLWLNKQLAKLWCSQAYQPIYSKMNIIQENHIQQGYIWKW